MKKKQYRYNGSVVGDDICYNFIFTIKLLLSIYLPPFVFEIVLTTWTAIIGESSDCINFKWQLPSVAAG